MQSILVCKWLLCTIALLLLNQASNSPGNLCNGSNNSATVPAMAQPSATAAPFDHPLTRHLNIFHLPYGCMAMDTQACDMMFMPWSIPSGPQTTLWMFHKVSWFWQNIGVMKLHILVWRSTHGPVDVCWQIPFALWMYGNGLGSVWYDVHALIHPFWASD